jgi:hypothetical protein
MIKPFRFEADPSFEFDADPLRGEAEFGANLGESAYEFGETSNPTSPAPRPAARRTPQQSTFALVRSIPDDPDYRKHVPINYRLNAKKIVGEVAQDLSSKGKSAHFWVELTHLGLVAAEIFAEASLLVAGLAIGAPVLALAAVFLALGAPYYEAAEKIGAKWAATGFSRGVVMGANKRKASLVKDYFGNDYFPPNPQFPRGRSIAMANYKVGLLVGYVQGRVLSLSPNQHVIFWRDLGHRMGNQSHRGPQGQWKRREWIDWYVTAAAVFRRDHLA